MSVKQKAVKSAIWLFADDWFSAILSVVSLLVLARLLGPEPYGLLGISAALLGVIGIFFGETLTDSLEQRDVLEPGHCDAIFWTNFVFTGLFALGAALLAPVFAKLFEAPLLNTIIPVLALIGFLSVQSAVPCALIARELDYKKLVIVETAFDIPLLAFSILLALNGFGVWSLILPSFVSSILAIFVYAYLAKWRPGFAARRRHFKELWRFNRDTVAANVLAYIDGALPKLALGYVLGERAVGVFGIAMQLGGQLTGMIMGPFSAMAMTVTARLQNNIKDIRSLMDDVFELATFIVYPAIIGAIVLMPLISPLLLGENWSDITLPIQIALLLGLRDATGEFNISILRGLGKTHLPLIILSAGICFLIAFMPFAISYGVAGMVALVTVRVFATWPLSAWFVQRATHYPAFRQFTIGWRSLTASLFMGGLTYAAQFILPQNLPVLVSASLLVLIGVALYVLIYLAIWPHRIRAGIERILALLRGDDSPESHISQTALAASDSR